MTRSVGFGLVLVIATEVLAVLVQRPLTLVLSGIVVAAILYRVRTGLSVVDDRAGAEERDPGPEEALRHWLARTETLIRWADRSRGDWDRHLRPLLAREFQMVTGHRRGKDRTALDATGRATFGADLWQWVDPSAVSYADRDQPAPGRAALDVILQRLVQM